MANTSTRVSRPEEEGAKRLVAMAGERDSGETCRCFPSSLFPTHGRGNSDQIDLCVQLLQDLCV